MLTVFYFFPQESIVRNFSFLPCSPDPSSPSASSWSSNRKTVPPLQFIHSNGSVFVLILSPPSDQDSVPPSPQRPQRTSSNWLPSSTMLSPTESSSLTLTSYITRHVVGRQKWQQNQDVRLGYLWAWNSMLSKRWRNPSGPGGDVSDGSKALNDFRKFCANDQNRLKKFWLDACDQFKVPSS